LDKHDDLILDETLPAMTEEDIDKLHEYLDEVLENCGDLCLPEFEDVLEIRKWHKSGA